MGLLNRVSEKGDKQMCCFTSSSFPGVKNARKNVQAEK